MTIEDEILQYLHYHPLSNRVEITHGITNPSNDRVAKVINKLIINTMNNSSVHKSFIFLIPPMSFLNNQNLDMYITGSNSKHL